MELISPRSRPTKDRASKIRTNAIDDLCCAAKSHSRKYFSFVPQATADHKMSPRTVGSANTRPQCDEIPTVKELIILKNFFDRLPPLFTVRHYIPQPSGGGFQLVVCGLSYQHYIYVLGRHPLHKIINAIRSSEDHFSGRFNDIDYEFNVSYKEIATKLLR